MTQTLQLSLEQRETVTISKDASVIISKAAGGPSSPKLSEEEKASPHMARSLIATASTLTFAAVALKLGETQRLQTENVYFSDRPPTAGSDNTQLYKALSWSLSGVSLLWLGYETLWLPRSSSAGPSPAQTSRAWVPQLTPTGVSWRGRF